MEIISFYDWLGLTERQISEAVSKCRNRAWNEDHISYSWLAAVTLREPSLYIGDTSSPFSVAWDAYKADSALEEEHGDIAFLVKLTFPNRHHAFGVAFLEAKRIYSRDLYNANSGDLYNAIHWNQLEYQASNVANHHLLLYDNEANGDAAENLLGLGFCRGCFPNPFQSVQAFVVPTPHAIALRKRDRELNALSIPLSFQICCRYLRGYDLDFNPALVKAVQSGAIGGLKYLVVAHASLGPERLASTRDIELNSEYYRHVDARDVPEEP